MGAELGRKERGQKTRTGMSEQQLKDFTVMKGGPHASTRPEHKYLGRFATGRKRQYRKDGIHLDKRGTFAN